MSTPVRCPDCRTIFNLERTAACPGCGKVIERTPGYTPPPRLRLPEVERAGRRDRTAASILLVVLACFGGLGLLAVVGVAALPGAPPSFRFAVLAIAIVLGILGVGVYLITREGRPSEPGGMVISALAAIGTFVLVGAALLAGLAILILVMCSELI